MRVLANDLEIVLLDLFYILCGYGLHPSDRVLARTHKQRQLKKIKMLKQRENIIETGTSETLAIAGDNQ